MSATGVKPSVPSPDGSGFGFSAFCVGFAISVWPTGTATDESPLVIESIDTPNDGGGSSGLGDSLGGGGEGRGATIGIRWTMRGFGSGGGGLFSGGGGLTSGGGSFSATSISIGGSVWKRAGSIVTTPSASRPCRPTAIPAASPVARAPPGRGTHRSGSPSPETATCFVLLTGRGFPVRADRELVNARPLHHVDHMDDVAVRHGLVRGDDRLQVRILGQLAADEPDHGLVARALAVQEQHAFLAERQGESGLGLLGAGGGLGQVDLDGGVHDQRRRHHEDDQKDQG